MQSKIHTGRVLPPEQRKRWARIVFVLWIAIILAWSMVTFVSPVSRPPGDPWYFKLGRVCGLAGAALILGQYLLSGRIKWLDRVYGLDRLLKVHRVTAVAAAAILTLHPIALFATRPGHLLHFDLSHWPLYLGAILLLSVWGTVAAGLWRKKLHVPFETWWLLHRIGTVTAVGILAVHVLSVSHDFSRGWPRWALVAILAGWGLFYCWNKLIKPRRLEKSMSFVVDEVAPAAGETHLVFLRPASGGIFPYLPGQFAFVRFESAAVSDEEHHFTLSSTPTWKDRLLYTIKCSGDFTCNVGSLKKGDKAILDGPYGLFSHLVHAPNGEDMVLVAGGIGITPMLSMLRFMADTGDTRQTVLVLSNKTEQDILCRQELEELQKKIPHLQVHHVLTRQQEWDGPTGHIDADMLQGLLEEMSLEAHCFVCGPPPMMEAVTTDLETLGFDPGRIHTERFAL